MSKKIKYYNANLLEDFRAGKQTAFTEIFHAHYSALSYYSYKITNDQESAQDIVSESFIKIWERCAMFFEINVLKSYLYTTVRNASINCLKNNAKIRPLPDDVDSEKLQSENLAFQHIIEAEVFDILTSALHELSPQGRQVIQMIYFEGKKTRVVAKELGVSQSTVKTQKGRALVKLKKSLKNLNLFMIIAQYIFLSLLD